MSTICAGSLITAGFKVPGKLKIIGTRTPPS
jgi:hypothetical protein